MLLRDEKLVKISLREKPVYLEILSLTEQKDKVIIFLFCTLDLQLISAVFGTEINEWKSQWLIASLFSCLRMWGNQLRKTRKIRKFWRKDDTKRVKFTMDSRKFITREFQFISKNDLFPLPTVLRIIYGISSRGHFSWQFIGNCTWS